VNGSSGRARDDLCTVQRRTRGRVSRNTKLHVYGRNTRNNGLARVGHLRSRTTRSGRFSPASRRIGSSRYLRERGGGTDTRIYSFLVNRSNDESVIKVGGCAEKTADVDDRTRRYRFLYLLLTKSIRPSYRGRVEYVIYPFILFVVGVFCPR